MKKIKTENAVGMKLAHDITRIVPGRFKGAAFKKGQIVRKQDVPALLKVGKQFLYVLDLPQNHLHEDDAALRMAKAIGNKTVAWTRPSEGKSRLIGKKAGLLKINISGLAKLNRMGQISIVTLKNHLPCEAGQTIAAARIIPLSIEKRKIEKVEQLAKRIGPIVQVLPFKKMKVGAVVTGSEIYKGLIKDEFDRYVGKKIIGFGSKVIKKIITPDDPQMIAAAIKALAGLRCDLILTTGGLSVDPDDATRKGIKQSGARIVVYGAPIMPGAMFLYAKLKSIPILGLPACVYYHSATVFDLMLPRVLAGEAITRKEIALMGHGGLCMHCKECRFPVCPFGK
ncbi:MAG: molybdopterin-binding protein [Desulfobacteraceae bacterium]|nr:MAG: molybdopterin-binding protein [Desulfobacteraceae bacterium]